MNVLKMLLRGDDSRGFEWILSVDGIELFHTEPMSREDMLTTLWEIGRDKNRMTPSFCRLSDEKVMLLLEGFFYGDLNDALRPAAEEQSWAKHVVGPAAPAKVWSHMYLVECDESEDRLIVCHQRGSEFFRFPHGEFDDLLGAIRKGLEERTS
jgi:hypothetical protein